MTSPSFLQSLKSDEYKYCLIIGICSFKTTASIRNGTPNIPSIRLVSQEKSSSTGEGGVQADTTIINNKTEICKCVPSYQAKTYIILQRYVFSVQNQIKNKF